MSSFARGKKSKAISDRSGLAFPYREMMYEWNGSFVHKSEWEPKHPQLVVRRLVHPSGYWEMSHGGIDDNYNPEVDVWLEMFLEICTKNAIII